MNVKEKSQETPAAANPLADGCAYLFDASQRWILFLDILRRRGNNYFDTIRKGEPPVLVFDYEVVMDGRTLPRPVNHDLARILPRNTDALDPNRRPIVVIDPRAGNGPGIGGSKRDSEIGDALAQGHPVYFVLFHPEPVPGQTVADVEQAEVRFVEEVARRHPHAEKPAVIGNCQAGWAVALLGADRPDLTGPLVLNGSPLSYWAGVQGRNPMRYAGGLLGGAWLVSFLSDLGHGRFDGAWLEENFESLNPGNTFWTKQYDLYAHVDTEEERYLTFEKWWDGYSEMTREEMHAIVENLFIGNKLERGKLSLDRKKILDLRNIERPMILFASEGDNITPPQQALDWIIKAYRTTDEIRRAGRVIVYMLHPTVGHLGIFVGAKTAQKEHMEIIRSIDMVEALPPGLFEMEIVDKGKKEGLSDYDVRFVERDISDLMALNEDKTEMAEEDADFARVAAVSEINDRLYNTFVGPWVRTFATESSAAFLKQIHPLRVSKYVFADTVNPFMTVFAALAPAVKHNRRPASADNYFSALEKFASDNIAALCGVYQDVRDHAEEALFFALYENPWTKRALAGLSPGIERPALAQKKTKGEEARIDTPFDKRYRLQAMTRGGFEEGLVRIVMALEDSDHVIDRDALWRDERLLEAGAGFGKLDKQTFIDMARDQSRLLQADADTAFRSLGSLITTPEERRTALAVARRIVSAEAPLSQRQKTVLARIGKALRD